MPVAIKEIYITGNKVTRPRVIYREITLKKGDYVLVSELPARMRQSELFLINTHLFLSDAISDTIILNEAYIYIKVKERFKIDFWHPQLKPTNRDVNSWLQQPSLYRLTYGLQPAISNLTGQNDKLTVSAILGWRQTYAIDYRFPYINKAKTLGIENIFSYQQGHEVSDLTENNELDYVRIDQSYIYHKISWETDLIYRRHYQVSHIFTIGFDYYNVSDTITKANPDYLGAGRNTIRVPRMVYQLTYDKRDYSFYAKRGDLVVLGIEHDGLPVLLKDIDVTTIDLTYRKFIPLGGRFYYQGGFTSEYDLQGTLPYVFRSSLGYRYDVSGFENYIIDGRAYIVAENELKYQVVSRFVRLPDTLNFKVFRRSHHVPFVKEGKFNPVPVDVYLKIFTDQGGDFYGQVLNNNSLTNKFLSSIGAGVDVVTYYDFIWRTEYSFNNLGKGGLFFHFTEVF